MFKLWTLWSVLYWWLQSRFEMSLKNLNRDLTARWNLKKLYAIHTHESFFTYASKVEAWLPDASTVVGARCLPALILSALSDTGHANDRRHTCPFAPNRRIFHRFRPPSCAAANFGRSDRIGTTSLLAVVAASAMLPPGDFPFGGYSKVHRSAADFDSTHAANEARCCTDIFKSPRSGQMWRNGTQKGVGAQI